jgi:tetratricopeptide (TPR) repeat protein
MLGDYDKAIDDLDRSLRLDPNNAYAYKNRGRAREMKHDLTGSLLDYTSALRLKGNLKEAQEGRARVVGQIESKSVNSPQVSEPVPRLSGADLLVDLNKYVGRPVVLLDGNVFGANNSFALVRSGGATFSINTEGIEPETFRFILGNCSGLQSAKCKMNLEITPTGGRSMNMPIVSAARMVP